MGPVDFEITGDDVIAFRRYYFFDSQSGRRRLMLRRLIWFLLLSGPAAASVARALPGMDSVRAATASLAVVGFSGALAWLVPAWLIKTWPDTRSLAGLGHWQFTAAPQGLAHVHIAGSATMPWNSFNRIERSASALYVFEGERAYVLPLRAFESEAAANRFAAYIQARLDEQRDSV